MYIYSGGQLVRHDNNIQYVNNIGEKTSLAIETISDIFIMSEMTISTSLLSLISKYGIVLHHYDYYYNYVGSFYPKKSLHSGFITVKQVENYIDKEKRLYIAIQILEASSSNIYRNLRYYNSRGKDVSLQMQQIESLKKSFKKATSIQQLMGYEGNIRKVYYSAWELIINQDLEFNKRVKNPPDNEINTLVSFINSLIYNIVLVQLRQTQLDATISFLHEPQDRRFSLALDISEIFKPIIVDRLIFSLLNKKQITSKSFTKNLNGLHLKESATKLIFTELDNRLKKTIKHETLNKDVSYKYLIRLEGYKLIKHLTGEKTYEGFEMRW